MIFTLHNSQQAHTVLKDLWPKIKETLQAGKQLRLEVKKANRSNEQNDMFHALIDKITKEMKVAGSDWDAEIKEGIETQRPLQNLYALAPTQYTPIETEFNNALNRKTTDDDTHPSPADRFRLVAQLKNPVCAPRPGEVWDLFKDREAITREMMATLEQRIAQYRADKAAPAAQE